MYRTLTLLCLLPTALLVDISSSTSVTLVTFDGKIPHIFRELNDPVMGGRSNGTWTESGNGYGTLDGYVNTVPKLHAPGFIEAWSDDGHFADASSTVGGDLVLTVRSSTPNYEGFRVSFAAGALSPGFSCAAGGSIIGSRGCYKSRFTVPKTSNGEWATVRIPFSNFTDKWSSYTGDPTKTCDEDSSCCVTASKLGKIQALGFWGEGKEGKVHLEVKSVVAEGASLHDVAQEEARPPAKYDICGGGVQKNLRYNISSLGPDAITAPVDVGVHESLATAICCDARTLPYAEPRFLFQSPFIDLFAEMDGKEGPTTFYDSVCGIPLFSAPVNRTLSEFKADTMEHGWPSFRPAEIHSENVITNETSGYVFSKCGTHLGSYLPDEKGARWCLDLSCLAGNEQTF